MGLGIQGIGWALCHKRSKEEPLGLVSQHLQYLSRPALTQIWATTVRSLDQKRKAPS